jgi:glyoxylase-like metal-dependent hydrolase (beta-lactamase superfamily II)
MDVMPTITPFVLGGYATNCHVVTLSGSKDCWVVDVGFEPQDMLDWIESQQLTPRGILLTHCHVDHIAGIDEALARFGPLPLSVHEAEAGFCSDPMLNLSAVSGALVSVTEPDTLLRDGEVLKLGESRWRVLHTPGHSPGGVAFVHDDSRQAIVGDTLFAGSIGRFDFPTSSADDLRKSVRETLMNLPDDCTIFPGHGPTSTIGGERRTNPYVAGGF